MFLVPGYQGTVWAAVKSALTYFNTNLNTSTPANSYALASAMAATLRNALNTLAAYNFYLSSEQNYTALAQLLPLPLTLDAATSAFMTHRINALQSAVLSAQNLPGTISPANVMASGQPVISDPGYLEWLMNFSYETPPAGLSASNFITQAQAAATAWQTIKTALLTQGIAYSGSTYNAVLRMYNASQVTANEALYLALSPNTNLTTSWNQIVAQPSLVRAASILTTDPTSMTAQNVAVIRYAMIQLLNQIDTLLISIRNTVPTQVSLTTVRQGDSLMDIANRELGNFELWTQIATLNGLQPPYISTTPGPNVAVPGQSLFLPQINSTQATTASQAPAPNYEINYLGVDKWYGPMNQQMLPWTGDFQVISGYQNLAFSLGRRLQTALTTLIFHPSFGSRIPPEVGKIADQNTAGYLEAYTTSALLSDPRVNRVLSVNVSLTSDFSFEIDAVVLPNGPGSSATSINLVIGPAP